MVLSFFCKGLVLSNQKTQNQCINSFSKAQDNANFQTSSVSVEETANKIDDEPCPICQERYYEQKMMFQCGHSLCCKCKCYCNFTTLDLFLWFLFMPNKLQAGKNVLTSVL